MPRSGRKRSGKQRIREEREALADLTSPKNDPLETARRQLKSAAKGALILLVVAWLLAIGFWSGLDSLVPIYIAAALTLTGVVAAFLIRRNLQKSEDFGSLVQGAGGLSAEDRDARIAKLQAQIDKGDATAILAKAQLQMSEAPRDALATLETIDLDKVKVLVAGQVRVMRAMIHLSLGEVKAARELADAIDLTKVPDPKSRANLSAVVAESWARSGNPIEAAALLDKYDPDDKEFEDSRTQLLRARVFTSAHKQDLNSMRRYLKALIEISPQLAAMFVGQKRIHPLLEKEARRMLEKSGMGPKPKVQMARR